MLVVDAALGAHPQDLHDARGGLAVDHDGAGRAGAGRGVAAMGRCREVREGRTRGRRAWQHSRAAGKGRGGGRAAQRSAARAARRQGMCRAHPSGNSDPSAAAAGSAVVMWSMRSESRRADASEAIPCTGRHSVAGRVADFRARKRITF